MKRMTLNILFLFFLSTVVQAEQGIFALKAREQSPNFPNKDILIATREYLYTEMGILIKDETTKLQQIIDTKSNRFIILNMVERKYLEMPLDGLLAHFKESFSFIADKPSELVVGIEKDLSCALGKCSEMKIVFSKDPMSITVKMTDRKDLKANDFTEFLKLQGRAAVFGRHLEQISKMSSFPVSYSIELGKVGSSKQNSMISFETIELTARPTYDKSVFSIPQDYSKLAYEQVFQQQGETGKP